MFFDVKPTMTVKKIMQVFQDKGGVPMERQRFTFQGKEMGEHSTMSEYDLQHESIIVLELRG